jgi:hypothetical protein
MSARTTISVSALALTGAVSIAAVLPPRAETSAFVVLADDGPAPMSALIVLNDNGAWSWFEDERAVIDPTSCTLLVSTVANRSGTGGIARHGNLEVVAYDLTTLHATLDAVRQLRRRRS